MQHDALIFDIDGTLWNASKACADGWNKALFSLDIKSQISAKDIENVSGKPFHICVETLLPGCLEKHPTLLEKLNLFETEQVKKAGGVFYPYVLEGLQKLKQKYKLFLLSNCQAWYIPVMLEFSGLNNIFIDADCFGYSGILKDAMLINMRKKHSLLNPAYIGDTLGDAISADTAGVNFYHAAYGFGERLTRTSFHDFKTLSDYFIQKSD